MEVEEKLQNLAICKALPESPRPAQRDYSGKCPGGPEQRYLDVVPDEGPAEVIHLQHGGCVVVHDGVALQDVLCSCDLPGEPTEVKRGIAGQQVRQVARLTAATASVVLITFHDGLDLSLLAVGSWQSTNMRQVTQEVTG